MRYTVENLSEGILNKLSTMTLNEKYKHYLYNRILLYPKEIEQNVLEWINDQPITDIDCHGESIKNIMTRFNLCVESIPYLIENFVTYAEGNFRVYSDCYGFFSKSGGDIE